MAARSNLPAVVGPVQQRLALPLAAGDVARLAMALHLADVPPDCLPAADLTRVLVRDAASQIIAAVPLKPAARIVAIEPALAAPDRQRLAGIDAEIVQRLVARFFRELGARKPARRKFLAAISHVLTAEHTEPQHLRGREIGAKFRIEVSAGGRGQFVTVAALHLVGDGDDFAFQRRRPLSTSGLTTLIGLPAA